MADFLLAIEPTLKWEGFYSNRASDRGRETYAGITRRDNPGWPGWAAVDAAKPLRNKKRVPAADIHVHAWYRAHYWNAIKGDQIDDQRAAGFLFDWYVNSGTWAVIHAQRLVGVDDDGVVGPKTLAAINAMVAPTLFVALKAARLQFVMDIVAHDPGQAPNLKGWRNRINSFV